MSTLSTPSTPAQVLDLRAFTRPLYHLPVLLLIIRLLILEWEPCRPLVCACPLRKSCRRRTKQYNPQAQCGHAPASHCTKYISSLPRVDVANVTVDQAYAMPERHHSNNRHSVGSLRIIVFEADRLSDRTRQWDGAGEEENDYCKDGKAEAQGAAEIELEICSTMDFASEHRDDDLWRDDQRQSLKT